MHQFFPADGLHKIALPTAESIEYIKPETIIRCQSEGNYTCIYLTTGEKKIVSKKLKEWEEKLKSYPTFLRIHRSHIINLQQVAKYHKGKGGQVVLVDGSMVDISADYKEEFLKRMC